MPLPLEERKDLLNELVNGTDDEHLQSSGVFDDPIKLLKTCEKMRLEGIVSKRRDGPYRPGPTPDWLKIKTAAWTGANAKRFELLKKRA